MNKFIILSFALLAIFGAVHAQNLGGFLDQAASLASSDTANTIENGANSTANSAAGLINANPNLTNSVADQVNNLNVSTNQVQDSLNSAAATAGATVGGAIAQPTDTYNTIAGDVSSLLNHTEGEAINSIVNIESSVQNSIQNAANSLASSLGIDLGATTSNLLGQLDNQTGIVSDIKNISMNVNASDLLNQAGMIVGASGLGLANLSNLYSNLTNNVNQIVDLNTPFNGTYLQCVQQNCASQISACNADTMCSTYYANQQGCFSAYQCDTFNTSTQNCYDVCLNTNQTANDAPFAALNQCALNMCTYQAVVNSTGVYDILGNFFSNAYVNSSTAAISVFNAANTSELYNNATMGLNISAIEMNGTMLYANASNTTQSYLNLTSMGAMNVMNATMVDGETIVGNVNATLVNSTLAAINNLTDGENNMMNMMNNSMMNNSMMNSSMMNNGN